MVDLLAIIMTCTPHLRNLTLFIMAPQSIVRYVVLTLWLQVQVQVQVWFSIPVIVLFRCLSRMPGFMSDPKFYVSSYYSGCSHEQTRDRLAGDARVDDPETSRRLPRNIQYSPCVVEDHCLGIGGASSTLAFFCLETINLENFNKLYLDFRCSDD